MRFFVIVLLLLIGVALVLLATQDANTATWVPLQLPFVATDLSSPILGWIAGSLGVGFLLGYLIALPGRVGAASRARKAEKELARVEAARAEANQARAEAAAARTDAQVARTDAQVARTDPRTARVDARAAGTEADEMQRLADEVARRTSQVQRDAPPPREI